MNQPNLFQHVAPRPPVTKPKPPRPSTPRDVEPTAQAPIPASPQSVSAAPAANEDGELVQLLLTEKQAATVLAISVRKLWELRTKRAIPFVRIGRSIRYSPADLQAWIDDQKQRATGS